ncbi:MAG: ABC transporter substrate-binding protein [Dehalococcoidales bacterium]
MVRMVRTKLIWVVVTCLMILSLIVTSCGQAEVADEENGPGIAVKTETKEQQEVEEKTEEKATVQEEEAVSPDVPRYGGTYTQVLTTDPRGWDETKTLHFWIYSNQLTNQMILEGDWSRGPAGTGEFAWTAGTSLFDDKTPHLVESYELVEPGYIRWHVRPGIHYGLNPDSEASRLVGGREYTAEDLEFSLRRLLETGGSYINRAMPIARESAEWTLVDKYTLDLKVDPDGYYNTVYFFNTWTTADIPREVVEKYGNMNDWRNVVGTGPFMLTDYVPSSQQTLIRNPNYWQTDPVGPGKGNQLPYVDTVRQLILPDASTRLAAMRTGKLDDLNLIKVEEAESLWKTNPELEFTPVIAGGGYRISLRLDKPELPHSDIRVRRALNMAIDFDSIIKDFFSGQASMRYAWPCCGGSRKEDMTLPIEERSAEIQELYSYQPEKAKQLLADAGYPDGFKIKVTARTVDGDYLSLIKFFWDAIGVDMELDLMEQGAYNGLLNKRASDEAIYNGGYPGYIRLGTFEGDTYSNSQMSDDQYFRDMKIVLQDLFFAEKQGELDRIYREEIANYVLEQVYVVPTPAFTTYNFWQPWLRNYNGARNLGWTSWPQYAKYVWIDENLK